MRFADDFHEWRSLEWKSSANRLTRDPKIVIHSNSCIILYISGGHIWNHQLVARQDTKAACKQSYIEENHNNRIERMPCEYNPS